jgi:hypothetical protein
MNFIILKFTLERNKNYDLSEKNHSKLQNLFFKRILKNLEKLNFRFDLG